MKQLSVALSILFALCFISCSEQRYPDPLPPEEALKSFQLDEGFNIELFAAEPDVLDPVEMVFDEQGHAFVVEMPDYPYKPEPGQAKGRIRMLADSDGDGRVDQSTIFADSLSEATSILPWKGGLIVTTAPHIIYLKDTTGDFKADTKEVLFSGFFENNSEAQITNLRFGVDNWIYAANHGQPGEVKFSRKPGEPALSMQGADFRFRLDRELFEAETGPAQFGQTLNDWGHRFITQNTIHMQQAVIAGRYLYRNPHLPSAKGVMDISDHGLRMYQQTPAPYWRAERSRRRQEQYDAQNLDRIEHVEDHFTGASGGTMYTGDAFPESFYGNIFTGEVAGNLVHRDRLVSSADSPVYVAKRNQSEQDREFLASTDPWFRPVNFTVGPDGYLYVIDMYRQHIETPLSIPEDLKEDMDFFRGSEHGRIYRILPKQAGSHEQVVPDLKKMETQELVELLSRPGQWWRLQAQRLLLERQDVSVIPALKSLFAGHEDPRTRLHALYVLEGLNALDAGLVKQALGDAHPGVREHGVMLSERYPVCLPQVLELAADTSARVVLQVTLSLGEFSGNEIRPALAQIIETYGDDPWFRLAVLSSDPGSSPELLKLLLDRGKYFQETSPEKTGFLEDFAFVIGARNQEREPAALLSALTDPALEKDSWRLAGLKGLGKGLEKGGDKSEMDPEMKEALLKMQDGASQELKEVIQEILTL